MIRSYKANYKKHARVKNCSACFLFVPLAFVCLIGCGSSGPFDYVRVSGKAVYEDGTPVPGKYQIVFVSQATAIDGKMFPRPATAIVEEGGVFSMVTSHKYGDGLIPGKHKVFFSFRPAKLGEGVVPQEFRDEFTTTLEIDTKDAPLEITIPKPTA